MAEPKKGFSYAVSRKQVLEYRSWPMERRLKWLFLGNKMRKSLPQETIKIQDAFRKGEI